MYRCLDCVVDTVNFCLLWTFKSDEQSSCDPVMFYYTLNLDIVWTYIVKCNVRLFCFASPWSTVMTFCLNLHFFALSIGK